MTVDQLVGRARNDSRLAGLLGEVFALAEGDTLARQRWSAFTDRTWPAAPSWGDALTAARQLGLAVHRDWDTFAR